MDFKFTAEEESFRQEVKGWLKANIPPRWFELATGFWQETDESWKIAREFQKSLVLRDGLPPLIPKN